MSSCWFEVHMLCQSVVRDECIIAAISRSALVHCIATPAMTHPNPISSPSRMRPVPAPAAGAVPPFPPPRFAQVDFLAAAWPPFPSGMVPCTANSNAVRWNGRSFASREGRWGDSAPVLAAPLQRSSPPAEDAKAQRDLPPSSPPLLRFRFF